jgi:hypothetical protein
MTTANSAFPDLSDDAIATIARKTSSASSKFAKMEVLEEAVGWEEAPRLLWQLASNGDMAVEEMPGLWKMLARGKEEASTGDIVRFLQRIDSVSDEAGAKMMPGWPVALDDLVCRAHADAPGLLHEHVGDISDEIRAGVRFALARLGDDLEVESPEAITEALATTFVQDLRFPTRRPMRVDGEVREVAWVEDDGPTEHLYGLVERLGGREVWNRAILRAAQQNDRSISPHKTRDGWRVAEPDQLVDLLANTGSSPRIYRQILTVLLDERDDDPAVLLEVARTLRDRDVWDDRGAAETTMFAALHRANRRGEPAPEVDDDLWTMAVLQTGDSRHEMEGLALYREALEALPEDRAVARLIEVFERPAENSRQPRPWALVQLWPDRADLLEAAFAAAEAKLEAEHVFFASMNDVAHGLALAGSPLLDRLQTEEAAAEDPLVEATYRRAILYILADRAAAGDPVPDEYHEYLTFGGWHAADQSQFDFDRQLTWEITGALGGISPKDRRDILHRELDADGDRWARALPALARFPADDLFARAFERVAAEGVPTDEMGKSGLDTLLDEFDSAGGDALADALAETDDPEIHNAVEEHLGEDAYRRLLARTETEPAADASTAETIRRLAEAWFDDHARGQRQTLYVLEPTDGPVDDAIGRIGGPPVGIAPDDWPCRAGDSDWPMTHVWTLDLAELPDLRRRLDEDIRAVALFVHNPSSNEAWRPGTPESDVRLLTRADVDAFGEFDGPLPADSSGPPTGYTVQAVDIPEAVFSRVDTASYLYAPPELRRLRDAIYAAPARAGADPIWLQGATDGQGPFLLQFDEAFADINLGDNGVMYVFGGDAFWQSH